MGGGGGKTLASLVCLKPSGKKRFILQKHKTIAEINDAYPMIAQILH